MKPKPQKKKSSRNHEDFILYKSQILCQDEWFMPYPGDYVDITVYRCRAKNGYSISIWGWDDIGMTKFFKNNEKDLVRKMYRDFVNGKIKVTKKDLKSLEFMGP